MAGKFSLDPRQLDDQALERELRYLYARPGRRRSSTAHGRRCSTTPSACLQLEQEYTSRFPEWTRPDALRPAKAPGQGRSAARPLASRLTSRAAPRLRVHHLPFQGVPRRLPRLQPAGEAPDVVVAVGSRNRYSPTLAWQLGLEQ